jgi:vacuolar-type H+-ATPase subunit F/Vma7
MTTYHVRVVATPEVAAGFALAGLETVEAPATRDGGARVIAAAAQPETGVLLVEAPLLALLSPAERRALERRATPIVIAFPTPAFAETIPEADAIVLEILRRAVGYRVRLQ